MLKELNQKIGRVLVGRYLQGADQSNLLKKMSDETIGISVVGESFLVMERHWLIQNYLVHQLLLAEDFLI